MKNVVMSLGGEMLPAVTTVATVAAGCVADIAGVAVVAVAGMVTSTGMGEEPCSGLSVSFTSGCGFSLSW